MKTLLRNTALLLFASLTFCQCNKTPGIAGHESATVEDSAVTTKKFQYTFKDNKADLSFEVEAPVNGSEQLRYSVGQWISSVFGDKYMGDVLDTQAMLDYYGEQNKKEYASELALDDEGFQPSEHSVKIKPCYQSSKLITFSSTDQFYLSGAAHGMSLDVARTFVKDNGNRLGWNIFKDKSGLQEFLKKGLKKHFDVTTDDELAGELIMVDNINNIPLPENEPWITSDGIVFSYAPYEISYFAAGQPTVVVPYIEMKSLLTDDFLRLISD